MSLTIKLLEKRCAAHDHLILSVVVAGYLTRQVTVGETHFELVAVLEACAHDLDHSVALRRPTLRVDLIDTDGRIEQASITARIDVREDAIVRARALLR